MTGKDDQRAICQLEKLSGLCQAAHKYHQSALLAHPEISNEKIWYRKNEKLFDHQQIRQVPLLIELEKISNATLISTPGQEAPDK